MVARNKRNQVSVKSRFHSYFTDHVLQNLTKCHIGLLLREFMKKDSCKFFVAQMINGGLLISSLKLTTATKFSFCGGEGVQITNVYVAFQFSTTMLITFCHFFLKKKERSTLSADKTKRDFFFLQLTFSFLQGLKVSQKNFGNSSLWNIFTQKPVTVDK